VLLAGTVLTVDSVLPLPQPRRNLSMDGRPAERALSESEVSEDDQYDDDDSDDGEHAHVLSPPCFIDSSGREPIRVVDLGVTGVTPDLALAHQGLDARSRNSSKTWRAWQCQQESVLIAACEPGGEQGQAEGVPVASRSAPSGLAVRRCGPSGGRASPWSEEWPIP
jgi:hypothetical protein